MKVAHGAADDESASGPFQGNLIEINCESSDNNIHSNGFSGCHADSMTETTDISERYPSSEATPNHGADCSTSGPQQVQNFQVLQRIRSHGIGERNKRKRWRGRQEKIDFIPEVSGSNRKEAERSPMIDGLISREDKYDVVLAMKELASRGMAAELVEEINSMDPNFFNQHPDLLFQLKQVEFLKLVRAGNHPYALKVACSHLGPLAASDPALLRPLKDTLLALLRPKEETLCEGVPLHALATSVQVAIGRRLGIQEPQLMKIMKATLHTHCEWFKLQMCKDRFEGLLRINSLKELGSPLLADAASRSSDISIQGSSHATASSGSGLQDDVGSPTQTSAGDVACDENAILKVMEFLALPRADAIHLLAQYNGNAETVIQQIFA